MKNLIFLLLISIASANAQRVVSVTGAGGDSASASTVTNITLALLPKFDIRDYGAIAGHTHAQVINQQVAIQNAIIAAETNGGGQVYFPKGYYGLGTDYVYPSLVTETLNSSLLITNNGVYLVCDSPGSAVLTQLVWTAVTGNNVIGMGTDTPARGPKDVGIINLKICGNTNNPYDLTQLQYCTNLLIEGCIFDYAGQDAIDCQGGAYTYINNIVVNRVIGNSISVQNLDGIVDGFSIDNAGGTGGDIECFGENWYISNGFFRNTTNSVNVNNGIVYMNNIMFYNPNANRTNIVVAANTALRISKCTFQGGGNAGAVIYANTNSQLYVSGDCLFTDRGIVALRPTVLEVRGSMFNTSINSIYLQGGDNVIVHNNTFRSTVDAIRMSSGVATHNIIFQNNLCLALANYYSDSGGTNHTIVNNIFREAEIRFQGSEANGIIMGNVIKGASGEFEHAGGGHVVKGNFFRNVNFLDTATSTFIDNEILAYSGNATGKNASKFLQFTGSMIQGSTNGPAGWPTTALTIGGWMIAPSNAGVYLLTSTPGSATWAATNKLGGPN